MGNNIFLVTLLSLLLTVSPWCYKTHFAENDTINEVDISPDRTMVITSSKSRRMIIWNFTNLHPIFTLIGSDEILSSKFSKDQKYIAVGRKSSGQVNILQPSTPFTSLRNISSACGTVYEVDWSWDNARLLICGSNVMQTWWVSNWTKQLTITNGNAFVSCKFQKDGKIGAGDSSKNVFLYLNGINTFNWTADIGSMVKSVQFDMVNSTLVAVNSGGKKYFVYPSVKVGGGTTQAHTKTNDLGSNTNTISFAKEGSILAIATDNNVLIFQNSTFNVVFNWTGGAVSGIFSYDGQYYLAGSSNGTVRIFKRMCQSCPAGYYQFNFACVACTQIMIGCLNCVNSSVCLACGDGYAIDTVNNNCTLCNTALPGCILCNSTTICTACSSIFYLASNACTSCQSISNCITCTSSSVCTSCNSDYYLDATFKCTTCTTISGCFTCLNSTACIGCVNGYYLNNTSLSCSRCTQNCAQCFTSTNCSQCLDGFSLSSSNLCVSCPANCMKCSSTTCINCIASYYINGTGCNPCPNACQTCSSNTVCTSCVAGYYSNSGTCSPCVGNCLTCSSSTACLSCNVNYYYTPTTNTCSRCQNLLQGCLQCTNTTCLTCQNGYYYSGSSCLKCSQANGCQRCINSTFCLSCITGYQHISSTGICSICGIGCASCNSTACFNCLPKYYLSSGSCLSCPYSCPTCISSTTCLFCLQGFYLNSTQSCVTCNGTIPNCITCSSNTYCTSCQLGYSLNSANSSCVKCTWPCTICNSTACFQCAVGYYLNSPSCSICPSNCSSCNTASICTSCANGYYLSSANTCLSCLTISNGCQICNSTKCINCLSNLGYYLNSSTSLCNSCSVISNCIKCSSGTTCTNCIIGYYVLSNACSRCSNLVSNCQNCNSTTCLACVDPYFLSGSACQLCSEGCYSCYNSSSCKSCLSGYLLQSAVCNFCNTIIKGCQVCTSSSVCTQCQQGYILSSSTCNSCASFMFGCLYCNGTTVCTSCIDQYYLSGTNSCTKCSNAIAGCSQCSSSSVCLECIAGYFKNSSNLCSQCSDSMCFQCSNSTFCTSCLSGYAASTAGVCQQCSSLYAGCVQCTSSVCKQCVSGFYLNSSNQCSQCLINGCEICNSFNSNQCVTCSSLYYLSASMTCISCTLSIEGCFTCISSTYCTKCLSGYYLAANFTCQPCFNLFKGCKQCTAVTCSSCEGGYIMNVTTCSSCMQFITGCQYCSSTTVCLSCQSGYYTLGNSCLSCTNINGCLDCSNSSTCNICSDSFYFNSTDYLCYTCATNIVGCITCSSPTFCKSCHGNYSLSGGVCTEIQSVSTKPYRELRMVTEYVNSNILKHNLIVKGTSYTKASINLAVNSNITMVGVGSSQLLTITSFQWGDDDNEVIFYTNNPLGSLFSSQFKKMPTKRLLASQKNRFLQSSNVDLNYQFQLQMSQSAIQAILPSSTHTGSLSLKSLADDPSFVRSLYSQTQYNYHYMGLILTILMLVIYFIKAAVTVPNSDDQGQIISHIFLLKCGGLVFSLVYLEYIDYCFGFLSADLHWFNSITTSLSTRFDLSPNSYLLFYSNMTLASTYLVALCVIAAIAIVLILIGKLSPQKLESVKVVGMFFYNFFQVGLIIAGSASIQGAYYNDLNYITNNSMFYIVGILIYLVVGLVNIFMSINNLHRINKIRIFVKATFLSLLYVSPIYLLPIAIGVQLVFIIFEYNIKKATKLHPHVWLINQFIVNIAFVMLVMFSQSMISIYSSFILVVLAVIIDLFIHISQFRHQEQIIKVKEIQNLTKSLQNKEKLDKKIKKKNNTIYQRTRKNDALIINQNDFNQDIQQKIQETFLTSDNIFLIDEKHMKTGGVFSLDEELQSNNDN